MANYYQPYTLKMKGGIDNILPKKKEKPQPAINSRLWLA
jgi:hypothetical protein